MTSEKLLYAMANIDDTFIEEAEKAYERGKISNQKDVVKYLAAAAALAVILLGVTRPAVLAEAAQAVIRWFEDHVSYHFRTETTLESVPKYELCGLEDGYRLIDESYQGTMGSATYQSADRKRTIYFLYGLSDGEVQVPGEGLDYKLIVDGDGTELHYIAAETGNKQGGYETVAEAGNGQGGYDTVAETGGKPSLTWVSDDGQIVFSISGDLGEEELLELRSYVTEIEGWPGGTLEQADSGNGFEEILASLTEEQAYAVWQADSEHPILLVAEGTYEIDGVENAAILCEVYGLQDGAPRYLGYLACGGTAYPLTWDENYIYVAGGHFRGRYGISEQMGTLRLSDGLCYIPAEDGYRVRRDAAVEETFDENGEPNYISGGEWLDEESGEELLMQLEEEAGGAEIICFTK